jgi:RecA/RadA recombinase
MFSLILAAAYLKKNPDAAVLFYDSEFGTPQSYFEQFGIDLSRVVHVPITDIEMLKHDIANQVTNITRGDKVFILIDSIGNLASKKEVEDSLGGKSVADMTRAKQLKSLFRMITPHLAMKNLPMVVINHTYAELSLFPKQIVSGGTGAFYSSDTIWIIGRQQEKDGKDVVGYNFVINIEKSRYAREKSKIPITVTYDHGIHKYSGVFDAALGAGLIKKATAGYYSVGASKSKQRRSEIEQNEQLLQDIIDSDEFKQYISETYTATGQVDTEQEDA